MLKIVEKKFKDKIIIRITHTSVNDKGWKRIQIWILEIAMFGKVINY